MSRFKHNAVVSSTLNLVFVSFIVTMDLHLQNFDEKMILVKNPKQGVGEKRKREALRKIVGEIIGVRNSSYSGYTCITDLDINHYYAITYFYGVNIMKY